MSHQVGHISSKNPLSNQMSRNADQVSKYAPIKTTHFFRDLLEI